MYVCIYIYTLCIDIHPYTGYIFISMYLYIYIYHMHTPMIQDDIIDGVLYGNEHMRVYTHLKL